MRDRRLHRGMPPGRAAVFWQPGILDSATVTTTDDLLSAADSALRTLSGAGAASRACPAPPVPPAALGDAQRRLSGALMRVNHVGEICAQALYNAQALSTRDPVLRRQFEQAAREETDHLAWCGERLGELSSRPSLLNPLWYAGSFAIGAVAALINDRVSLGFVVETERQVEAHLGEHLEKLPDADARSRAIVAQMQVEEARHGANALAAGAIELPEPVPAIMRLAAGVMKAVAYRL